MNILSCINTFDPLRVQYLQKVVQMYGSTETSTGGSDAG
ncbi:hypothetical protein AVDCRST_MAG81-2455 [uncultured Synechococcales cyanobacterium]|uniref:Uncharacterized protein n=1 Tax=uncultured Synechococcales cyanobacterium TaxID=1936017 RepID=A0A6J4VGT2_9CYAN|nr:hypothetical protein AVDCRST_MAG81-2455 [uncultured Synechococcales cyanobacterium]